MDAKVSKVNKISGELAIPGDKSISHRAVMLGSLCEGDTFISNFLPGEDCFSTMGCMKALGIQFDVSEDNSVLVHGNGITGLKEPEDVLNAGNSGTTLRLLSGILAGQPFFLQQLPEIVLLGSAQ